MNAQQSATNSAGPVTYAVKIQTLAWLEANRQRSRCSIGSRTLGGFVRQVLAYLCQELARTEWLGDVTIATGRAGLSLVATQSIRCHSDDWNRLELGNALNLLRRFIAIHFRELNIHQNEIRPLALR